MAPAPDAGTVEVPHWWSSDAVPDRVAPSCLFDSTGWLRQWARVGIEGCRRARYVLADSGSPAGPAVQPVYLASGSPFWIGYERQSGVAPLCAGDIAFAGSTYSMYSRRGPVPAALVAGAYATARQWVEAGEADLLVVPNLTEEGVASWRATAGPPDGQVLLDRTYYGRLSGDLDSHLQGLDSKIRRDVARRLRRSAERGLRVRFLSAEAAQPYLPRARTLTVGTTDQHDWPPLYDDDTLRLLLTVPGAVFVAAEAGDRLLGVFFGFRHDDEATFLCGGVDYAELPTYSTYVALMYRCVEWAGRQGLKRIEWGRDNYAFKRRHGLVPVDLWGLVYGFDRHPGLPGRLERMHAELAAYIDPEA